MLTYSELLNRLSAGNSSSRGIFIEVEQQVEIDVEKPGSIFCPFEITAHPEEIENARKKSLKLGLDLKGGMHLVMEVDQVDLFEQKAWKWREFVGLW